MAQLMTDDEPDNVVPIRGAAHETEEKRRLRAASESGIVSIESVADHKPRIARAET